MIDSPCSVVVVNLTFRIKLPEKRPCRHIIRATFPVGVDCARSNAFQNLIFGTRSVDGMYHKALKQQNKIRLMPGDKNEKSPCFFRLFLSFIKIAYILGAVQVSRLKKCCFPVCFPVSSWQSPLE